MGAAKGSRNRHQGKLATDALRKAVIQGKSLPHIARALISKAKEGDLGAIREIYDRLDGRAVQALEVDLETKVEIVRVTE